MHIENQTDNKVIAVFDIGKTNKKLLLFDLNFNIVYQYEKIFDSSRDDDGDECEDIEALETWLIQNIEILLTDTKFDLAGINFSTYGATLAFINEGGRRITPIYNYLKKIPVEIQQNLFEKYGGAYEFCRKTASPALGSMLNSGLQILWLKSEKPEIYKQLKCVLHFPQYLSFLFTGKIFSEPTSIGCHTFLWDFDTNNYHKWLDDESIHLFSPMGNSYFETRKIRGREIAIGIGIHDSSASLVPYMLAAEEKFILVSSGTWCINMNPFNHNQLTLNQLKNDCLSFLSVNQKPVKSSRFFMGYLHDHYVRLIANYFNVSDNEIKKVTLNEKFLIKFIEQGNSKVFIREPKNMEQSLESINLKQFCNYSEAYHKLMYDLTISNVESMELIMEKKDGITTIYVSGGFMKNEIFTRLLAYFYPEKKVYTSDIHNASALGAALTIAHSMPGWNDKRINLGIKRVDRINFD